uniref:Prolyl endopeptidase n=1 Tax=Strongyloides stercoralis TaxID=6248 RepID=A0AAF5CRV2_STRER
MNNNFPLYISLILTINCKEKEIEKYLSTIRINVDEYPQAVRSKPCVIEEKFNRTISDCYRNLENENSEDFKNFISEVNKVSLNIFEKSENRKIINKTIHNYLKFNTNSLYTKVGEYYYYFASNSTKLQSILKRTKNYKKPGEDFINVREFDDTGNSEILDVFFSPDGKIIAYKLITNDNLVVLRFRYKNGKDLKDKLDIDEFTDSSFFFKNEGFIYSFITYKIKKEGISSIIYDVKNELYYHKFGTDQKNDKKLTGFNLPSKSLFDAILSNDGKYLFVKYYDEIKDMHLVYYCHFTRKNIFGKKIKMQLLTDIDGEKFSIIDSDKKYIYVYTNESSVYGGVMKIKILKNYKPMEKWVEIIGKNLKQSIKKVIPVGREYLVLNFKTYLEVYNKYSGKLLRQIKIDKGEIQDIWGNNKNYDFFISLSNIFVPQTIYRINLKQLKNKKLKKLVIETIIENLPKGISNSNNFKIEKKYYKSTDNVIIPLYMIYKKKLIKEKKSPVVLEVASDFTAKWDPVKSPSILSFINNLNGVWCMAGVRGSLTYDIKWLFDGVHLNRKNSFADFISGIKFLINNKYTTPAKLAIFDGHSGGIIPNVVSFERPDLIGAVVSKSPVLDLLRINEIKNPENLTKTLFGDIDIKHEFENLISFSPYNNIRINESSKYQWPSTLIFSPLLKPTYGSAHTAKYLAKLYYKFTKKSSLFQKNPVLGFFGNYSSFENDKDYHLENINERVNMTIFLQTALNLKWRN